MSLLHIEDLSVSYGSRDMIAGVNMDMEPGEIVCLAGESGCGKSTLLKSVMNLPVFRTEITKGRIIFDDKDMDALSEKERVRMSGPEIGMVQQQLNGAFNPLRTYEAQFKETFTSHEMEYHEDRVLETFVSLNLPDGERVLKSRPFEMSGGMNQRIVIALAMLLEPKLLLCDEPTSALDVTTQKQVIEELMIMRDIRNTAILLVTHNLGVASAMADKIGIMYAGRMVEYGDTKKVLKNPAHPYTKALLSAIPDFSFKLPVGLDGYPPLDGAVREDCAFKERCKWGAVCKNKEPHTLKQVEEGHNASCILMEAGQIRPEKRDETIREALQ